MKTPDFSLVMIPIVLFSGCSHARKPVTSVPVPPGQTSEQKDRDVGTIVVNASLATAVSFGEKRLDLSQLTGVRTIFDLLVASRQSQRVQASASAASAGLILSVPLLDSVENTAKAGSESTAEGTSTDSARNATTTENDKTKTETEIKSEDKITGKDTVKSDNETKSTFKSPAPVTAPPDGFVAPSGPGPVSATPYELFYATAETFLAARALESLYNIEGAPDGVVLFKLPVVVSFDPGAITRNNYTGEAILKFTDDLPAGAFRLWAVAPAGLSSFANSVVSEVNRVQTAFGLGLPLGALNAQLGAGLSRTDFDAFASIAKRPDLQVSIADNRTLVVRYMGRETFEGGVALSPASFNLEV